MSHYPLASWNSMRNSSFMLHGHSHYSYSLSRADNLTQKILDVGADGHDCKPWSYKEVLEVMNKKQVIAVGHHKPLKDLTLENGSV